MATEEMKKFTVELTEREAAVVCIFLTQGALMTIVGGLKDPLTKNDVDIETIIDVNHIVEKINVAMGQPPSPRLEGLVEELKKKWKKK